MNTEPKPERTWDLFVSHASEDKDALVRPLAQALTAFGLTVWYDETELRLGDSLSESINRGLANSRQGLVVLSRAFFEKDWPKLELRGLFAQSVGRERRLLPIWHGLNRDDMLQLNPILSDLLSESTNQPLEHLALKIVEAVNPNISSAIIRKFQYNNQIKQSQSVIKDVSQIQAGPIRHPTLPVEMVNRIKLIRNALRDVYPDSIERWIEGFQRDSHPAAEVEICERIASAYVRVNELVPLGRKAKQILYETFLMATMGGPEAFDKLKGWSPRKLEAVRDAISHHPEYFAPMEENFDLPRDGQWLNIESFTGDEAKIDQKYVNKVSEILGDLRLKRA